MLLLVIAIAANCQFAFGDTTNAVAHFNDVVAPLLAKNCISCHNGFDLKGKLNLQDRDAAFKGGESGKVIVFGDSNKSLLWEHVRDDYMPPENPLGAEDKAILKNWIENGAKWGDESIDVFRFSTNDRAGRDWWSLKPLSRPKLPVGSSTVHPIDALVRERLIDLGIAPSPQADRRTLIRRLSFDLTGLPPSPEEAARFIADASPEAYEKLIDRLLESPQYGERWARHWLDVARYGESDGFEYDRMRPNAWHFRDWVIHALNDDMPYDEFCRLQIAGDILNPDDPNAITATGFLVCGAHDGLIPKGDVMRKIMRQDTLEDFVGTVSQTFLGLTTNCARCHDHKFDPITQQEYYQIAAALSGVNHGERKIPENPEAVKQLRNEIEEISNRISKIEQPVRERILSEREQNKSTIPQGPTPIAAWDFRLGSSDQIGSLHAELQGSAKLTDNGLVVGKEKSFAQSAVLNFEITEKTLEAWVRLGNLDQRGGGAITLQTVDGIVFDSIVFGEREPKRWMAGSNGFQRTKSFNGSEEKDATQQTVHFAISYTKDGTVTAYRNGEPYGTPYKTSSPITYKAGNSRLLFGLRHGTTGQLSGTIERTQLYDRALTADEVKASAGLDSNFVRTEELVQRLSSVQKKERADLLGRRQQLQANLANQIDRKVYAVVTKKSPVTHVLTRGNPLTPSNPVVARGIASIGGVSPDFELSKDAPEAEGRKQLANWVANAQNPLFARVIVNRLWHYYFGQGIVTTPNDLGFNGGMPSNSKLLDWLATELIEKKWSLKALHKVIVTSETYKQSSLNRSEAMSVDADNRFLWKNSSRRLQAEEVRDAILFVAGKLNPSVGGPPFQDVRPYMHRGAQFYEPIDPEGDQFNRRSIYRMWARGGRSPLLDVFDCPDPSAPTPSRASTTTPLQALAMLNNSFVLRMSDELATRIKRDAADQADEQIKRLYQLAYLRHPSHEEISSAVEFVKQNGLGAICRVILNSNEFLHVE